MNPKLQCPGCGAKADASCSCGLDYKSAEACAALAVAADPERSNRVIGEVIGVHHSTVGRARRKQRDGGATCATTVGKDGVRQPAEKPARKKRATNINDAAADYRVALLLRVDSIIAFQKFPCRGPVTLELVTAARNAAKAWSDLAHNLETEYEKTP